MLQHIRETSDLHLEFYYDLYDSGVGRAKEELSNLIPPLSTDKKTVLVVAGDLATARRAGRIVTFMEILLARFKHIIFVLGNHEHYNFVMDDSLNTIIEACKASSKINMKKLTIVGNTPEKVEIGGVTFLCGTLWTDYASNKDNCPHIRSQVERYITDHRVMLNPDKKSGVSPQQLADIHRKTVAQFGEWMEGEDNKKTVVVTHHMPTMQAVDPQYTLDETTRALNHAFATDLDDFILKHQPAIWFFGHTHTKYIGKIGESIMHCNPLGYPSEPTAANNRYDSTQVYSL